MPSRRLPNSMITIIRALRKARDEWKLIANPADRAISTDHH